MRSEHGGSRGCQTVMFERLRPFDRLSSKFERRYIVTSFSIRTISFNRIVDAVAAISMNSFERNGKREADFNEEKVALYFI
jgi:hypothetical protein